MSAPKWPFAVIVGLSLVAVVLLGWQRNTAAGLRAQIVRQRAAADEQARLERERQRLTAAQVSTEELARLRAERAAVTALLVEMEAMKRRADATTRAVATRTAAVSVPRQTTPSMKEGAVPSRLWKNVGQATPEAAFESVLWAAAGGDLDALVALLVFDAEAQAKAATIFATLPATMRQELATPERLIALLGAKDAPLGSAEILSLLTPTRPAADTKITANLVDAEGKPKEVQLAFRVQDDRWRLVVPARAVARYGAQLQRPEVPR